MKRHSQDAVLTIKNSVMTTIQKLDFISKKYLGKKYEVLDKEQRDFVFSIYLSKYAIQVLSPKRVN